MIDDQAIAFAAYTFFGAYILTFLVPCPAGHIHLIGVVVSEHGDRVFQQ